MLAFTSKLYDYIIRSSVREPEVLRRLRIETHRRFQSESIMQIAPEQGQFMRLLLHLMGAKRVLEVGVFTGYSALSMALALPKDGHLIGCDISRDWTDFARPYWNEAGVAHKIDLRIGPAIATLQNLSETEGGGTFDCMFIDADKENYDAYYEYGLTLVRQGGLIIIDNTLWEGKVVDPSVTDAVTEVFRTLNAKIADDPRVEISMLLFGDGLTLARVL